MMSAHEEEYMDTDVPWYWYYLADCGAYHKFQDDPEIHLWSEIIEHGYMINSKLSFNITPRMNIDFSEMLWTDVATGRQRKIKHFNDIEKRCSCFNEPPVFWENFDSTRSYQLIPLNKSTLEYQTVENYVKRDGLLNKSIISILRIQNFYLFQIYCSKKELLKRIQGLKYIPEKLLFHGTDPENVDSICENNFDLRLAGKHGSVCGKGIYFAIHASYADGYSKSRLVQLDDGGRVFHKQIKIMFLARVIVGKYTVGKPDFIKPDNGSISCVDDINHPKICHI
ncbi:protein mono-ADP-ribosyltransferase PARP11-like [Nematolebias whitei]|uniref:protein mono-ADP-ribosyltransferase PARP11-like n=1 Tax=Nematolebias whitei TaxID=451745 RepID=UPI00189A513C|nr:protein mono-ADP-ribosyltransferase PARP11-like [Nematolebias whitei]